MQSSTALIAVKLVHTLVWAFFAGCVLLLPLAAHRGRFDVAAVLAGLILLETLILALNGGRCPLTRVAAHHTSARHDNFDIFLPLWLARYNKQIFASLFVAGLAYTASRFWFQSAGA